MLKLLHKIWSIGAGQIGLKLSNLWIFWYLADLGGAAAFGWIVFGAALMRYTTLVSDLGWNTTSLIETTRDDSRVKSASLFAFKLVWSLPMIAIAGVLAFYSTSAGVAREIAMWYVLASLFDVLFPDWFFQAKQKFHLINRVRLTAQVIFIALVLYGVNGVADFGLVPRFYFYAHIGLIPLIVYVGLREGFGGFHLSSLTQTFKNNFRSEFGKWFQKSSALGLSQICLSLSFTYGALILGFVADDVITGNFGFAIRLLGAFMVLDQIIHLFLLSGLKGNLKESYSYLQLATFFSFGAWIISFLIILAPISSLYQWLAPDFQFLKSHFEILVLFLPLTFFHSFIQTWFYHNSTSSQILKVSLYSAIIPFVIMTTTALHDPNSMPIAVIFSEVLIVTSLSYFCFKKHFKPIAVWIFLLGPLSLYIVNQLQLHSWSSNLVIPTLIAILISFFHPLRPTYPQIKPLLKRWKKLNK